MLAEIFWWCGLWGAQPSAHRYLLNTLLAEFKKSELKDQIIAFITPIFPSGSAGCAITPLTFLFFFPSKPLSCVFFGVSPGIGTWMSPPVGVRCVWCSTTNPLPPPAWGAPTCSSGMTTDATWKTTSSANIPWVTMGNLLLLIIN